MDYLKLQLHLGCDRHGRAIEKIANVNSALEPEWPHYMTCCVIQYQA